MVVYIYTLYKYMTFTQLGDTLNKNLDDKTDLKRQVEANQVLDFASRVLVEVFGREQAYHVKPLFLKNRTLTITCSSATMAQEIRLNQNDIVIKINGMLGRSEVDRIRYLS